MLIKYNYHVAIFIDLESYQKLKNQIAVAYPEVDRILFKLWLLTDAYFLGGVKIQMCTS